MKNKAQKALDEIKKNLYEVIEDYDWDENLELKYEPMNDEELNRLIKPLQMMIDNYPEWIPFTFDEEGALNGSLPDVGEEILISDGSVIIIETFENDGEGYYLDSSNWNLDGLSWMRLPKPHGDIYNLAKEIELFFEETDPFYDRDGKSKEEYYGDLFDDLESGDYQYIVDYIESYIIHGGPVNIITDACDILKKLKDLKNPK